MISIIVYRTLCLAPVLLVQDAVPPAESVGEVFPSQPEIVFAPLQPGDVLETFADVSDLERDIAFRPQVSLDEGKGCRRSCRVASR